MTNKIRATDLVPIFNSHGNKISEVNLPEKIIPIPTKRGGFSESGVYYKGSGIVYRNHLGSSLNKNENTYVKIVGKTGIVYENYILSYPNLVGKFGIFTFPHQAIFSDMEGGCGKKEIKLIENQKIFERSAIEQILDIFPIDVCSHNIYAYRLKTVKGSLEDTLFLIKYILEDDWNTAWDKNLWGDIVSFGYVRDVADWFKSDKLHHKIGTIFALLNSLYKSDISTYAQLLLKSFGTYSFEKNKIVYFSALFVNRYNKNLFEKENIDVTNWSEFTYKKLLRLLFIGKACCHLEDDDKWQWVRDYYIKNYLC